MSFFSPVTRNRVSNFITFLPFFVVLIVSTSALAQQRVSRQFPAGKNVRLELKSGRGTITLRLPANCGFHLVATAPAEKIKMGEFWHNGLKKMGEGRRIIGDVGDGRASVTIMNYQGDINFLRR